MDRNNLKEILKSFKDVEPSGDFRRNVYLRIEGRIEKGQQRQVMVPMRIFTFSTAVSLLLIFFISSQIAAAAQSGSNTAKLSPIIERITPFVVPEIDLSNFSSIHNCINMFEECKCLIEGRRPGCKCPRCN
jgi:hypothetical protein